MAVKLIIDALTFSYGRTAVLRDVTLRDLSPGQITAAVGPNGAGKSTLLKCVAGILQPQGKILLDGTDVRKMKQRDVVKIVSYLPQEGPVSAVLTVFEAVLLARQQSASWRVSDDDLAAVYEVLEALEIEDLALRYINELSGGQKQMISIAQSLVRKPSVLLLDEPTSSLDMQHQLEVFDLVREVTEARQITTLVAMHDLNLAARYADQFAVICNGELYATGNARSVLVPEMLEDVYGVKATVHVDGHGIPQITPVSSVRRKASPIPVVNRTVC